MFTKKMLLVGALLIGVNFVSAGSLERSELLDIFSQLTASPQKTWMDGGTITAVHEQYQAAETRDEGEISTRISEALSEYMSKKNNPIKGEGLKKMKLDAIPFNVRHELSNEFTMVTHNVMKFAGEKFYRRIDVQSRVDSVRPGKGLEGNIMTENFRVDWNGNRVFAYNGEEFTMYTPGMKGAYVDGSGEIPHGVGGEAVVGKIPWGSGYFSYENLASMDCYGEEKFVDGEVVIELTFGNFNGYEVVITLLANKDYAVSSFVTNKNNGITINKFYSNYSEVGGFQVPGIIVFEEYDNDEGRVLSRNVWEFTSIDANVPDDDEFEVDYLPDTVIEYSSSITGENQIYLSSGNLNSKALLAERLEFVSGGGVKVQNCATACLSYAAEIYGSEISESELEDIVDGEGYTRLVDMRNLAVNKGLNAKACRMSVDDLENLDRGVTAVLYLPEEEHFVLLESADSECIRLIDFTSRKFNYRVESEFFKFDWSGGVGLLVSDGYIPGDFEIIGDSELAMIKGDEGYMCTYPLQEYDEKYCVMIQGECGSNYKVWHERWGCEAADSGTCYYKWHRRTSESECIEDLMDPFSCIVDGIWYSTWMQACL